MILRTRLRWIAAMSSAAMTLSGCHPNLDASWDRNGALSAVLTALAQDASSDGSEVCVHQTLITDPFGPIMNYAGFSYSVSLIEKVDLDGEPRFPDPVALPSPLYFCTVHRPSAALTLTMPDMVGGEALVYVGFDCGPGHTCTNRSHYLLRRINKRWQIMERETDTIGM